MTTPAPLPTSSMSRTIARSVFKIKSGGLPNDIAESAPVPIGKALDLARKRRKLFVDTEIATTTTTTPLVSLYGRVAFTVPRHPSLFLDEHGAWAFSFALEDESGLANVVVCDETAEALFKQLKQVSGKMTLGDAWGFVYQDNVWVLCEAECLDNVEGFALAVRNG